MAHTPSVLSNKHDSYEHEEIYRHACTQHTHTEAEHMVDFQAKHFETETQAQTHMNTNTQSVPSVSYP